MRCDHRLQSFRASGEGVLRGLVLIATLTGVSFEWFISRRNLLAAPEGRFYLTMRPSGLKKSANPSQIPSLNGVCPLYPFLPSLVGIKEIWFGKATPRQSYD